MKIKMLFEGVAFLCLVVTGQAQNSYTLELTFVDHLKAGLIEQDVFVTKAEKEHEVYRIFPEERETYLDATLFKSQQPQTHNPFDRTLAGPFTRGESIDVTLRQWLQARGTAKCTCEGGWGKVSASFENLMPNAVYTMWHAFMAKDNVDNFIGTLDLPIGERDGTQSVFRTDASGKAQLDVKFEKCLQLTDSQLVSMLAIAWHSDGKTYGITPGPFGQVTHLQLFALLPDVDDVVE